MARKRPDSRRKAEVRLRRTVYRGRYRIEEVVVDHDRVAGKGRLENVHREIFERGDSAAALIHDVERDIVVLTEQFRAATLEKGPGYIIELAAGSVDPGEEPEECIRRELLEETGYKARKLVPVCAAYASPGATSERLFLFYALVRPKDLVDPSASGLAAEKEDIRRVEIAREVFLERLEAGVYDDMKVVAAGWWLRARPRKGKPLKR